jgi:hypothetical protein
VQEFNWPDFLKVAVMAISVIAAALSVVGVLRRIRFGSLVSQSKISFWFSLVFASVGFLLIVLAVFLYSGESFGATVAQFAASRR